MSTVEEYVVHRVLELEEENRHLKEEIGAYKEKLQEQCTAMTLLRSHATLKNYSSDNEPYISFNACWKSDDPKAFEVLKAMLDLEVKNDED